MLVKIGLLVPFNVVQFEIRLFYIVLTDACIDRFGFIRIELVSATVLGGVIIFFVWLKREKRVSKMCVCVCV